MNNSMPNLLDKQYKLLLEEERRFAKRIAFHIRAQTPHPWWHIFIPFKFLLEYFSLKKDVRNFSAKHVYLKQIALSAAYRSAETRDPDQSSQEMQAELRDFWLHVQKLDSQELYKLLGQWMDMLFRHYDRLLQTHEENYLAIIRKAYNSSGQYQNFLDQLTQIEKRIDQAVQAATGTSSTDPYIHYKQKAIQDLRSRELRDIFTT